MLRLVIGYIIRLFVDLFFNMMIFNIIIFYVFIEFRDWKTI